MTFQKQLTALCCACGLLALILDSWTALQGATDALTLCFRTVVPSLFPFLFLCSLLSASLWGSSRLPLAWLTGRLGIPAGGDSLLLAALLGGYPAGAQAVSDAYRENRLGRQDAQRLLAFCSNAGPAFLFGMVSGQFTRRDAAWALWTVHLLSAFLTGILHSKERASSISLSPKHQTVSQILTQTVKTMGIICGWIMLFQILSAFAEKWVLWRVPVPVQILIRGLLELSAGCCALSGIGPESLRFVICSILLAFGGICVLMQTMSVIAPLSIRTYLRGKLLQTLFSLLLSLIYLHWGWNGLLCSSALILTIPEKLQKRYGFLRLSGV